MIFFKSISFSTLKRLTLLLFILIFFAMSFNVLLSIKSNDIKKEIYKLKKLNNNLEKKIKSKKIFCI